MSYQFGLKTDVGKKRSQNQDSCIALSEMGLFIVSDGMGGHLGGEIASSKAVEIISQIVKDEITKKNWDPGQVLTKAFEKANQEIFEKAKTDAKLEGMGTTTTALLFKENVLTIGHVGDSRCYFCRPQAIWQLTRDHSLVQEKLRAKMITREQAKNDRMKNVITRSVGFERELQVELYQMETQKGDCFLICSDGLSGMASDQEILDVVNIHLFKEEQIQVATHQLIEKANLNGGEDNVTAILIQFK